ncbi:Rieske 2Fe-2S domain-containing protein [Pigmentiphaga sp. YJ18]|uniref:Rieske 2Fe-2S domain-containing protein n=1 Tax=Pigmentiphaga sp. YJ18 TaxID=3134907 RepID=UPI00311173EF
MLSHEKNERLCRVEGAAPMGALMRRHWLPLCLVEEVAEPDGAPVHARLLGLDLVVFRDTQGRIGALDEKCPHRRVSLVYGRNEEGGLRCLYHGWKMDVTGQVLDMASEPETSPMASKVRTKAYPTREWGGMVWVFLGKEEDAPEFVPPPWAPTRDAKVSIAKVILPCNWAQVLEGAIDSAHSSSLHSSDFVPAKVSGAEATDKNWLRPSTDKAPRLQVERTPYGFRYAAIRRPIFEADTQDYVRSTVFVAPFTVLVPPNNLYNVANVNVPMDDTNTAFYFLAWGHPAKTPDTETWRKFLRAQIGPDVDDRYRPHRNHDNRFWQDRQAMKAGNFTGITGFPNQDIAMWVTMGALADRSEERLGTSDLAIVEFRRRMLTALDEFAASEAPIALGENAIPREICSFQAIVPKSVDWREYKVSHVWDDVPAAQRLDSNYEV